ncbi:MAG: DUF916 domain-containing protein, partial [Cellulomonas sp.]|nr:DUF916 domain-containing protein [Cellulomonas sp.]
MKYVAKRSDDSRHRQPPRFGRVTTSVLSLTLLLGAGALSASAAVREPDGSDADQARWGVQPYAAEGTTVRDEFSFALAKGESATDAIVITNLSSFDLSLDLYGADAVLTDEGEISVADRATPVEDVGSWFHFDADAVTVPAETAAIVPFTVTAPADATPGDHCGGVLAGYYQEAEQTEGNKVLFDSR